MLLVGTQASLRCFDGDECDLKAQGLDRLRLVRSPTPRCGKIRRMERASVM